MNWPRAQARLSVIARRWCQAMTIDVVCVGATLAHAGDVAAKAEPRSAQGAWTALLGMADKPLPRGTGCHGDHGQPGHARRPRVTP